MIFNFTDNGIVLALLVICACLLAAIFVILIFNSLSRRKEDKSKKPGAAAECNPEQIEATDEFSRTAQKKESHATAPASLEWNHNLNAESDGVTTLVNHHAPDTTNNNKLLEKMLPQFFIVDGGESWGIFLNNLDTCNGDGETLVIDLGVSYFYHALNLDAHFRYWLSMGLKEYHGTVKTDFPQTEYFHRLTEESYGIPIPSIRQETQERQEAVESSQKTRESLVATRRKMQIGLDLLKSEKIQKVICIQRTGYHYVGIKISINSSGGYSYEVFDSLYDDTQIKTVLPENSRYIKGDRARQSYSYECGYYAVYNLQKEFFNKLGINHNLVYAKEGKDPAFRKQLECAGYAMQGYFNIHLYFLNVFSFGNNEPFQDGCFRRFLKICADAILDNNDIDKNFIQDCLNALHLRFIDETQLIYQKFQDEIKRNAEMLERNYGEWQPGDFKKRTNELMEEAISVYIKQTTLYVQDLKKLYKEKISHETLREISLVELNDVCKVLYETLELDMPEPNSLPSFQFSVSDSCADRNTEVSVL